MREIGYYWVKFYNHNTWKILLWTGDRFESFKSDLVHDEIGFVNEAPITKSVTEEVSVR